MINLINISPPVYFKKDDRHAKLKRQKTRTSAMLKDKVTSRANSKKDQGNSVFAVDNLLSIDRVRKFRELRRYSVLKKLSY